MSTTPEAESNSIPTEIAPARPRFPWPPADDESVVDAIVETWRAAVFRPASFFSSLPEDLRFGPALLYYLVVGILGAAIQLFWGALLPQPESGLLNLVLGSSAPGSTPLVEFLMSPLYLLLSLLLSAGVTHLLVLAFVPQHRGLGTTLRVFCFAYSTVLFGVVPYVGSFVGFSWMILLSVIGVRETHRTSTGRATAAVLVPLAFAFLMLVAAYFLIARSALLLDR